MYTKIDFHKNAVMAVPFDNEFLCTHLTKNTSYLQTGINKKDYFSSKYQLFWVGKIMYPSNSESGGYR